MLIAANFGLCATMDGQFVVKAPDWFFVQTVLPFLGQPIDAAIHPT